MFRFVIALVMFLLILRFGLMIIRAFAAPVPAPPEPGQMRKVDLRYRCGVCGAEVRMTKAADEDPPPPRHCMEEMEDVTPVE